MSQVVSLTLYSAKVGCPPISCCKAGSPVTFQLAPTSAAKAADGCGWITGVLTEDCKPVCQIGAGDWIYRIAFPDEEIAPGATILASDLATEAGDIGLCCLTCGDIMLLDKLACIGDTRSGFRESFLIFGRETPHSPGDFPLMRNHSSIEISAIEASIQSHKTGYPYAEDPGKVTITFLTTPAQQAGPFSAVTTETLVIDPASTTPLSNRIEFAPDENFNRLIIPAGADFAIQPSSDEPGSHCGLEIHVEFKIVEPN